MVQIRALAREIDVRHRRRILGSFASSPYVEEPSADFSCEDAEIRGRSSDLVRKAAIRELLEQGHRVRCFDLRTSATEKRSRKLGESVEIRWGDVCDPGQVAAAVEDQDAVIHCAAILFPESEEQPEGSRAVNVGGTRTILDAMSASPKRPMLVFPSSITVYGKGRFEGEPRRADEPVGPSHHYARHKVEGEELIRSSDVPWTILRIGVSVEPGASSKLTAQALRTMFEVSLDTRLEYVHPTDVARAMANALSRPEARSKVLMIGGGPRCQVLQREFFGTAFEAIGIGRLPEQAFGDDGFEMDWMDTSESQRILDFQRYSFDDFRADFQRSMRLQRWLLLPLRPLVRRALLHFSGPWRSRRKAATPTS
jgi:nucleoside-diphosphate-sugar epimerase